MNEHNNDPSTIKRRRWRWRYALSHQQRATLLNIIYIYIVVLQLPADLEVRTCGVREIPACHTHLKPDILCLPVTRHITKQTRYQTDRATHLMCPWCYFLIWLQIHKSICKFKRFFKRIVSYVKKRYMLAIADWLTYLSKSKGLKL